MSKRVISFSVYGNNPKYLIGAIKNAKLALIYYPEWTCRFYCADNIPVEIINELRNLPNTEIEIISDVYGNQAGMLWRVSAISDPSVDIVIVRDTDSRIFAREVYAVNEWLESDKNFHIMRDHPYHRSLIMGGMFGTRKPILQNINTLIEDWWKINKCYTIGCDELFLRTVIYPMIKDDVFIHDSNDPNNLFPVNRAGREFIGSIYDENDVPMHLDNHYNFYTGDICK